MASDRGGPAVDDPGDEFDQMERLTRRVVRAAAIGVPVWIVLLGLLPATGLGVGACLALATALAAAAVVTAERLRGRRDRAAPGRAGRRRPMSPLAAAALTLGVVAVVVYVIFVIRAA